MLVPKSSSSELLTPLSTSPQACKAGTADKRTHAPATTAPPSAFASSGLPPFFQSQEDPRSWCKDLSEKRVYKRFIDSYRLRIEDDYTMRGDASGLYGGEDPLPSFLRFLRKAKRKDLMPGEGCLLTGGQGKGLITLGSL